MPGKSELCKCCSNDSEWMMKCELSYNESMLRPYLVTLDYFAQGARVGGIPPE